MRSKDRIIIQKVISYIEDIEEYIKNLDAETFLDEFTSFYDKVFKSANL